MFDKLVVSTAGRRKHRTARFFVVTSAIYLMTIAAALALSVFVSSPRLADTNLATHILTPVASGGSTETALPPRGPAPRTSGPDWRNPRRLEDMQRGPQSAQPMFHRDPLPPGVDGPLEFGPGAGSGPVIGSGPGIPDGDRVSDTAFVPPPVPVTPRPTVPDRRPLALTSVILQGKAIERHSPDYPMIARQVKVHGDVPVEVIVSPDGRVESARAISGHPLLVPASVEAARRWRFEPTLLNGVPVRVTGVITFAFKLGE